MHIQSLKSDVCTTASQEHSNVQQAKIRRLHPPSDSFLQTLSDRSPDGAVVAVAAAAAAAAAFCLLLLLPAAADVARATTDRLKTPLPSSSCQRKPRVWGQCCKATTIEPSASELCTACKLLHTTLLHYAAGPAKSTMRQLMPLQTHTRPRRRHRSRPRPRRDA